MNLKSENDALMEESSTHPVVDFTRSIPPLPPNFSSRLRDGLMDLAQDDAVALLARTSHPAGSARDRKTGAEWLTSRLGETVSVDRMIVTNGTQSAIRLLFGGLAKGGLVLAESLSWGVVRPLADRAGVRLKGLPIDDDGIIPAGFERACQTERPAALYCNPTDQNPTTAIMPEARRLEIATIARRYGVPIIEDDALGRLHPHAPRPIAAIAPDICWYVMGLTKCLAQGLRLAYMVAPTPQAIEKTFGPDLRLSHWVPSPLTAEIVARWISNGAADEICDTIRGETEARAELARRILAGADMLIKPAAMHLWLRLPDRIDRHAFVADLQRKGVLTRPAEMFAVEDGPVPNAVRLSLSSPLERSHVEHGLNVIAEALGLPRPQ